MKFNWPTTPKVHLSVTISSPALERVIDRLVMSTTLRSGIVVEKGTLLSYAPVNRWTAKEKVLLDFLVALASDHPLPIDRVSHYYAGTPQADLITLGFMIRLNQKGM